MSTARTSTTTTTTTTWTPGTSGSSTIVAGTPAEVYERHFVPAIGRPLAIPVVEAASLRDAGRVVDVACGTGVATRLAAERVGAGGAVVGVDAHPGMLDVARRSTPAGATIDWRQASADGLPFADDSFDAALCSLGLQFFADKVGSLAEMGRVVSSGGLVVVGVPGPIPAPFEVLAEVLSERLGPEAAAFVRVVFSIDETSRLQDLMAGAGLTDISVARHPMHLRVDPPADFFWRYVLGTPLADAVSGLGEPERAELEGAIVDRWQPFASDDGLGFDVDLILAVATVE